MILRASRPPPTSRAPAPSAISDTPPVAGSIGAGAGGAGAGGGAGAALGAGAGGGGGGLHGALACTPPALESMIPSLQLASAFAAPAVAVFALASATI